MASTEIVRIGVETICDYLLHECRKFIEKKRNWRKNRWWIKPWVIRRNTMGASVSLLNEWAAEDQDMFRNHLRMSQSQFEELLVKVEPLITKQNTTMRESLSPKLKLQLVLRYLATGDSFASLEALYRVPRSSISKFLTEVLHAISTVLFYSNKNNTATFHRQ